MKTLIQALRLGAVAAALAFSTTASAVTTLTINSNASDPAVREGLATVARMFEEKNPDVRVQINTFDHEGFKTSIRNFLTAGTPPDVVTWFAGNRMAPFVRAGLFEDVSDVWAEHGLNDALSSTRSALTIDDKQWGVPYTYYQWGIYYRKDIFERLGLQAPKTWDELLAVSQTLAQNNITPFTIGTRAPWPAAGWFDYLNLRVNGYEFHMALTNGEVSYSDPRVRAVFDRWGELVQPGYFIRNHAALQWQEAVPAFVRGEAAMYLMGQFAVALFEQGGLTKDQIGFMPFPEITPGVPRAEDAPTDSLHIPSAARNKAEARRFLAFVTSPEAQTEWNRIIGQLPVNKNAAMPDDVHLRAGFEMLSTAHGLAQFYDRDVPAEMAQAGMNGFVQFMAQPDRLDTILQQLDRARERAYRE